MSKINNRIYAKAYGHDQEEGCCCSNHSHGHEHHHEHGHHHEHEHPHCHEHGHQPPEDTKHPDAFMADGVKLICLLENLGCANCAAKMESRINDLPEVNAATLTFTTKQLRVSITPEAAKKEDALIAKFQEICTSIEQDVTVTKQHSYQKGKKALGKQEHEGKNVSSENIRQTLPPSFPVPCCSWPENSSNRLPSQIPGYQQPSL